MALKKNWSILIRLAILQVLLTLATRMPPQYRATVPLNSLQTKDLRKSNSSEISAPICRYAKRCIKTHFPSPTKIACPGKSKKPQYSETGAWALPKNYFYFFDHKLANAVLNLLDYGSSIIEFGAGRGCYSYYYYASKKLSHVAGYDGAANVGELTGGFIETLDMTKPHDIAKGKKIDTVICFEVAEHIPQTYESTVVDNLLRPNPSNVFLSWGVPGQGGNGHVNVRENDYVINLMQSKGYNFDNNATQNLRDESEFGWFKHTLMVFRKS